MRFGIYTLDDYDVKDRTVLCRVDMNQPIDREKGELKSTARIEACIPTLKELSDRGAKTVILAHQGSDIEYKNYYTTEPHARVLSSLLGKKVDFIADVCGPAALEKIRSLETGGLLLLDNVRYLAEEQTLFEQKLGLSHGQQAETLLVRKLAPLADLYVCDAFAAAHRDQPSLCGFEQILPSAMGRLFEKEYCVLSELMKSPKRPCTFVLGGAKIGDAFLMMETVLESGTADRILAGGLAGNILLAGAGVDIGRGSMEFIRKSNYAPYIEKASRLYERYESRIVMPEDLAYVENGVRREAKTDAVPDEAGAVDIGAMTAACYRQHILNSGTVFANGPMGIFEEKETEFGTKAVFEAMGETRAYTVIGGGDSITAAAKYGQTEKLSYICTGGGALIRFLTGEELPVVKALRHGAARCPV
ncbi:phosphoglycerate kinase [Clostridium sp. AF15-17LB]|nr:phosphoglycerate kinase [Clostridium sp. AF15-17LB]